MPKDDYDKHTEAAVLANDILKAAGSGLKNYMPSSAAEILFVTNRGISEVRKPLIDDMKAVRARLLELNILAADSPTVKMIDESIKKYS